ncbi:hypothetical protein J6590_025093 [Homalodisca vitripennis]|nr:hypothetical protein J6590_025093 [Homalodisca vitripennis]
MAVAVGEASASPLDKDAAVTQGLPVPSAGPHTPTKETEVQDTRIKQRRAWLLLGWVTAERSCPCKQPAYPAFGGCSEVTFKPLVSVKEGFLVLT